MKPVMSMSVMKWFVLGMALLSAGADAKDSTNASVRSLLKRLRARMETLAEVPILKLLPSQDGKPRQGEGFTVFAQPDSKYLKANALLSATLDGVPVALESPTTDLWVFIHPGFNEIRPHTMVWTLHIEDADEAAEIRAALKTLDKEIAALQKLIDKTPPGSVRDGYIQQRDDKIALRNELLLTLERLKTVVGTETMNFEVIGNPEGATFPRISSILPNVGSVNGGTEVALQGANFEGSPQVEIGGFSVSATLVSSTEVRFTTPAFGTLGAKDVMVSFPQGDGTVKNAVLKGGFFAGVEPEPMPNFPPQASAGTSQVIALGDAANLLGTSFDPNQDSLSHSWTVISVADGSQIVPGAQISASEAASFTPDYPGIYVLGYQVTEVSTPGHLQSPVSLTTVRAQPPSNRPPEVSFSPASLTLSPNEVVDVQVSVSDPDFWQTRTVLFAFYPQSVTVLSFDGSTIRLQAGTQGIVTDLQLVVVDNGHPQQATYATLPITVVVTNTPPAITSDLFTFQMSEGFPLMIRWNVLANDPDGTISQIRYDYGDGTWGYGNTNPTFVGASMHEYMNTRPFNAQVWVRDNLGWESTKATTSPVDFTARATNKRPVNRVTASAVSGSAPLTVTFNGSSSFDPDGTIPVVRWNFGDGSPELAGGTEILTTTKTFLNPGTYSVRFRLRDNLDAESNHFVTIYVDAAPPAGGTPPTADFVPTPREVVLGNAVAFDGARSNDPNPDASTLTYSWRVFDGVTCNAEPGGVCTYAGLTASHTFGSVGNFYPSLTVQNQNGAVSASTVWEVHVVNQGHAPRAHFTAWPTSGAVPLTVNLNAPAGLSFDYDGTIAAHSWNFGDGSPLDPSQSVSHAYLTPGVYFVNHSVTDNDGNKHTLSQMITVNASLRAKTTPPADDEERAERRNLLTNACGQGQGEACFWLGKMHEEDGDAFAAQKLMERACSLGHQAACSAAPWTKW